MNSIIKILSLVLVSITGSILRGFVISTLWLWFLVPLGIPAISIVAAMGISLIVAYIWYSYADAEILVKMEVPELLGSVYGAPLGFLLGGYIISLFL